MALPQWQQCQWHVRCHWPVRAGRAHWGQHQPSVPGGAERPEPLLLPQAGLQRGPRVQLGAGRVQGGRVRLLQLLCAQLWRWHGQVLSVLQRAPRALLL